MRGRGLGLIFCVTGWSPEPAAAFVRVNCRPRATTAVKLDMTGTAQHDEQNTAQTSYQSILEHEITEGLRELERPTTGLLISGVSAGLDVSLSLFLMVVVLDLAARGQLNSALAEMLSASMYSVGFIVVIL